MTPFPGTPLYARLLADGRILSPGDWGACTLFDVPYRPARMTVEELEAGLRETFVRLYAPERVRARKRSFFEQMRAGRKPRRAL